MSIVSSIVQPIVGSIVQGIVPSGGLDPALFVVTFRTDNDGDSITLPLVSGVTHNFTVDWGDGSSSTITAFDDADRVHQYATAGDYDVAIDGVTEAWDFYEYDPSSNQIVNIKQWGDNPWTTLFEAFYLCVNLQLSASDAPNLSSVTDITWAFGECAILNAAFSGWDVSGVTDMSSFCYNAAISTANYDATLIAWSALTVQPDVPLDMGTTKYSAAAVAARAILTNAPNSWVITDGGPL